MTAYLLYETAKSSSVYYYSVDEFIKQCPANILPDAPENVTKIKSAPLVRLAGRVKDGSIIHNTDNMQTDFQLAGRKNLLPVRYYGTLPKNFAADREIIAEGNMDADGIFRANLILTRCESKYKAKLYQNN